MTVGRDRQHQQPRHPDREEQDRSGGQGRDAAPRRQRDRQRSRDVERDERREDALLRDQESAVGGPDDRARDHHRRSRRGEDRAAGGGDPARDHVDEHALVEERRRGEVDHDQHDREHGEAPRGAAERDAARARAGRRRAALAVHPGEDVRRGGQNQHARPDVDVERLEEAGVGGHQREMPDPHDVQQRDRQQAQRRGAEARSPGRRVGEDRPRAERHRIAAAAACVEVEQVRVGAGELVGHPLLDLGEGGQQVVRHPAEAHQAEEADEPGAEREQEAQAAGVGGRRGRGRGLRHVRASSVSRFAAGTVVRGRPVPILADASPPRPKRRRRLQRIAASRPRRRAPPRGPLADPVPACIEHRSGGRRRRLPRSPCGHEPRAGRARDVRGHGPLVGPRAPRLQGGSPRVRITRAARLTPRGDMDDYLLLRTKGGA